MTKDEALRLALNALEAHADIGIKADKAITAIKTALEAKDEPVAWRTFDGEGGYDYRTYENNEDYANDWDKRNPNHKGWVEPLYTTPPQPVIDESAAKRIATALGWEPKREWVPLTLEEIGGLYRAGFANNACFAQAVEARLKEKNGY
jgi:hypothetical protein